ALRFDSAADATVSNVFVEVAYNYTEARFRGGPLDGNRVPEIPLQAGSVTLGFGHSSGWQLSATVSHFGSFYTDIVNTRAVTLIDEDDLHPLQPGESFSA